MWYYAQNNQQMGPVSEDELKAKLRGGLLTGKTLVWQDGMSDWKPVSAVEQLSSILPDLAPAAAPPAVPPVASAENPYQPPQQPVQPAYVPSQGPPPDINGGGILAFAIIVTILCCPPFGIAGIVYAAQINSKIAVGDYLGAREAARTAMMWNWISFGIGLGFILLSFGLMPFR